MRAALSAAWLACLTSVALGTSQDFQEAPLVSWVPTKTYSSPGEITFKLLIKFAPVYRVLCQFQVVNHQMMAQAQQIYNQQSSAHQTFQASESQRLTAGLKPSQRLVSPPKSIDEIVAGLQPQQANEIEFAVQRCMFVTENAIKDPIRRLLTQPAAPKVLDPNVNSHHLANEAGPVAPGTSLLHDQRAVAPELLRGKRGLGDFFLGTFVSDAIEVVEDTVEHGKANKDLLKREKHLEYLVDKLSGWRI